MKNIGRKIIIAGVIAAGSLAVMVLMTAAAVSSNVKTVSIDDFKIDESLKVQKSWSEVPKAPSAPTIEETFQISIEKDISEIVEDNQSRSPSEEVPHAMAPSEPVVPAPSTTPSELVTPSEAVPSSESAPSTAPSEPAPSVTSSELGASMTPSEPVPPAQPAQDPAPIPENEPPAAPSGHYETVVITPERKVYDVSAFDEPVMDTFNVFYDFDGNILKMIPAGKDGVSTNTDGSISSDPVGEYSLYVVTNHLGRGNWYLEKHQVDTIHHEAMEGLSEEEFKDYKRSLGSKEGFVYKERIIPAETKKVWVED